ncbi:P-loop containing nucleoside triphosphate hydrolase protein [Xylogone sp. PMI_703]|nr:P-loop containing nucleoside triphosphate hydrolase protein [Xylogone sp. PMI_703]
MALQVKTPSSGSENTVVEDIMKDCGCNRERAIRLLQWANNDPDRAKHHHRTLMKYLGQSPRSLSPSHTLSQLDTSPILPNVSHFESNKATSNIHKLKPEVDAESSPSSCSDEGLTPPEDDPQIGDSLLPPLSTLSSISNYKPSGSLSQLEKQQPEDTSSEVLSEYGDQKEKKEDWDFNLPKLPFPSSWMLDVGNGPSILNMGELTAAIQHGADIQMIHDFFRSHDSAVKGHINDEVAGFPSIFFAVATNNEWIIRKWVSYGGNVNAVHVASKVPLLAFAIMHSEYLQTDTTLTVATLLSLGADPSVIPAGFYTPYYRDLLDDDIKNLSYENASWCSPAARARLARTANITQRYYLERASKTKPPSIRHKQIAVRRNAQALLGIPYFLIGQTWAANRLLQRLLNHLLLPSKRPLVLVFAGPSGHGKTELARRLGHLLSLELEVVDCTIFNREMELFGPREPYVGSEKGSPLNNFLARKDGERSIVFLDEFEKTNTEIHQSLLLPFDKGDYQDRRNKKTIDCSKTIWILATNALDSTINSFCKQHHKAIFIDEDRSTEQKLVRALSKEIKEVFLQRFGSPMTGRVSDFLPFLPFSQGEQAVIVHKYLLELARKVRNPVNMSIGSDEQLLGNIRMQIRQDASVCRLLAEADYHPDLGARSLLTAVRTAEDLLVDGYLSVDDEIKETNVVLEFVVDVKGDEVVANMLPLPSQGGQLQNSEAVNGA